jgi:hypothetical protein
MPKQMPLKDFRAVRTVVEEDDYALPSGTPEPPPSDLIPQDTWRHLTMLPDEVAVRTSNRHGTLIDILNQLASTWPDCVGDSEHPDPVGLAMIEMINEPDASLYNMLVGFFYRQAIDSLRIILDSVCVGAYCQVTAQGTLLQDWLEGNEELKFNEVATGLHSATETRQFNEHLFRRVHLGFIDQANRSQSYSGGWVRQLYQKLSKYSHGRPLLNNTSLWQSNGPIYVGRAVAIVTGLFIETFVASYIIVKLCRADFELPTEAREVFEADVLPLPDWAQVSKAAAQAYEVIFGSPLQIGMSC